MITESAHAGEMLRFFDLPAAQGGRITSRQFRGKRNLVLFFMDSVLCGECRGRIGQRVAVPNGLRAVVSKALGVGSVVRPQ